MDTDETQIWDAKATSWIRNSGRQEVDYDVLQAKWESGGAQEAGSAIYEG
jgi:hypothetical protein